MQAFESFFFTKYQFNPKTKKADFFFSFDKQVEFKETIDFSDPNFSIKEDTDQDILSNLLNHLHIALGISYYKLFPTKNLVIENQHLTGDQKHFWETFYTQGLGEFFYTNKISPLGLCNFQSTKDMSAFPRFEPTSNKKIIFFGGGKDSLVSIEKVKETGQPFDLFSFGKDYPLHQLSSSKVHTKRLIIQRELDPKLKEMSEQGYYNGHVPITGIISFVSLVIAYLYGYQEIITSNEKSANEENTILDGIKINHQRSKSIEFEEIFNKYIKEYISNTLHYYSILRNMYEIEIVKEFCQYPQYFHTFSSCNRNFHLSGSKLTKEQLRCGECPKCLFVYTMMRAFLPATEVNEIFGKNLFANESLLPLFKELLGIDGIKPFECVGTNEEMILALHLRFSNFENEKGEGGLKEIFEREIKGNVNFDELKKKLLT